MGRRIISTIALWSILIGLIYVWGLTATVWLITLLAVIAQNEVYNMAKNLGWKPYRVYGLIIGGCLPLAAYYKDFLHEVSGGVVDDATVMAVGFTVCALVSIRNREIKNNFQRIGGTFFGILLIPYMLTFYIRIAELFPTETMGLAVGVWVVMVGKFCDVGGLLVGSWLGKHKFAPKISPAKTWEGFIGGIATSAILGYLAVHFLPDFFPAAFKPWIAAACAIPIAAMAALSDLIESVIKRQAEVKDSGKSIPGIGGAFDLVDSLLLSAPVAFILLSFFAS